MFFYLPVYVYETHNNVDVFSHNQTYMAWWDTVWGLSGDFCIATAMIYCLCLAFTINNQKLIVLY